MNKADIQNLIKELVEKTNVTVHGLDISDDNSKMTLFSLDVSEPHLFTGRGGEALSALNHLARKIAEKNAPEGGENDGFLIDIGGFQKQRIDSVRAIAHMMAERARYFKSNVEVDPMSAFERRIIHEFLSDATDLKTESMGEGPSRRVVIRYTGVI